MISQTYGLAYPVNKNPLGLFRTSTGLDVVKADLMILLLTNPGERIMLLPYGTPLREYFFEPNDFTAENQIRDVIINAIKMWEPRITIESIEVTSGIPDSELNPDDNKENKDHIMFIRINFFDPNNIAQVDSLVLELPTISQS